MEATIILSAAMAVLMLVLLHTFFYAPKIADLEDDIDTYKKYVDKYCKNEVESAPDITIKESNGVRYNSPYLRALAKANGDKYSVPIYQNAPPPPAKIPGTVTDDELSLRDLINSIDVIISKMRRACDMIEAAYSINSNKSAPTNTRETK